MKLLSIQVGLPREVDWRGKKVMTGIFKEPVQGLVRVEKLNLEADGQATPSQRAMSAGSAADGRAVMRRRVSWPRNQRA